MKINSTIKNQTIAEKIAAYFGFVPVAELNKLKRAEPAPKREVLTVIDAMRSTGLKRIGTIQDEFVYIQMFANATDTYYLHINFDGELIGLFKQINCQHIDRLCKLITEPDKRRVDAQQFLLEASDQLDADIRFLTIKGEHANMQELYELTLREGQAVTGMQRSLAKVRAASVLLRD